MLLDTSGLLCLLNRAEPLHEDAFAAYRTARERLIHNYILAEFVPLAQMRRLPRKSVLSFVTDVLDNPDIEMTWVDESLHREAMSLLLARTDKSYSLCDAISFVVMRRDGIRDALTTDRHFEQEGFTRLLV